MTVSQLLHETCQGVMELVWPPKCSACGRMGEAMLCSACRAEIEPVPTPICLRCGRPIQGVGCRSCQRWTPNHLTSMRAAAVYAGPLRQAILKMKYEDRPWLAETLGAILAEYLISRPFGDVVFDALVPVPLHPTRQRMRGYNQAELLARPVAERLAFPVMSDALRRVRRTRRQADLDGDQRAANVRGAFAVHDTAFVKARTLLLIDDVGTTLHTLDECGRALLDAGAARVYATPLALDV